MNLITYPLLIALLLLLSLPFSQSLQAEVKPDLGNTFYAIKLESFFGVRKNSPVTANVYAIRWQDEWVSAMCSSPRYNRSQHLINLSDIALEGDRIHGTMVFTIVPDPWLPSDRKAAELKVKIDAKVVPAENSENSIADLEGTWSTTLPEDRVDSLAMGDVTVDRSGKISGSLAKVQSEPDWSDVTLTMQVQNLVPGTLGGEKDRRRSFSVSYQNGEIKSTRLGLISLKNRIHDLTFWDAETDIVLDGWSVKGSSRFKWTDLDGKEAMVDLQIDGIRLVNWIVGRFKATWNYPDGKSVETADFFNGSVWPGAYLPTKADLDDRPWFTEVEGFIPPKPGEHPRLFFRKKDVPALRERAKTPEGQILIARLKETLGGGEAMPTSFNPAQEAYPTDPKLKKARYPVGTYTVSHAAGFGFLYQLTGEQKYADLARKCVELAWAGQRDRDSRYSWVNSGGELRLGASLAWYAWAYDLCYDAWPEDFRRKFAEKLMNFEMRSGDRLKDGDNPGYIGQIILNPRQGPESNHFASRLGGLGIVLLAIMGDPGSDPERIKLYHEACMKQVTRAVKSGFGDGGIFHEGHGPGMINSDTSFLPYIQALRIAAGRDYTAPRDNISMITLLRVWDTLGNPPAMPYRSKLGSTYGGTIFSQARGGMSRSALFAQGFGAIPEASKPHLLWLYDNVIEPSEATKHPFDTECGYPHRVMFSFINWPFDQEAENPGKALPLYTVDTHHDHYLFRNRWQDVNDTVVTAWPGLPGGTSPRSVLIHSHNKRYSMGNFHGKTRYFAAAKDGSGMLTINGAQLFVDFSGKSGADVLVALYSNKPPKKKRKIAEPAQFHVIEEEDANWQVLVFPKDDKAINIALEKPGQLRIGKQLFTASLDDESTPVMLGFKPATENR